MSRMGLLDVHLELWVVVGFTCLVLDRGWIDRRRPPDDGTERILSFVDEPAYGVGSRVKVNGNALERG